MWKVLFLFLIGFSFNCGLTSDVDDNPGYRNSDILWEEAIDGGNDPTIVQLPNDELRRECNDNRDSQPSKPSSAFGTHGRSSNTPTNERKNFNIFPYLKTIENIQHSSQNSEYAKSFHSLKGYALNDEDDQLPRQRKSRPPEHYEYPFSSSSASTQMNPKKLNSKQNDCKVNSLSHINQMSENSKLKSLLKMQQFSGFSLSEILQQRNLSLSDLLNGKTEVISALRASDGNDDVEETSRNDSEILISVTTPRIIRNQPKNDKKHDKFEDFSLKIPTSTYVPINPTTITVKSSGNEEIMEFSDFSNRNERPETTISNIEKFHRDMDSILNIQNILTSTESTSMVSTTNAAEVLNTVTKREDIVPDSIDVEYQNEEPMDSNHFIGNDGEESVDKLSPVNHRIVQPKDKIHEEILSEIEPEARAEILELLNSSATAEKLTALLRSRNMSLEELIELRQRGSSQLHLAQVKTPDLDSHKSKLHRDEDVSLEHTIESSNPTENPGKPMIMDLTFDKFIEDDYDENDERKEKKSIQLVDSLNAFESFPFTVPTGSKISDKNYNFGVNNSVELVHLSKGIYENDGISTNKNIENVDAYVNGSSFHISNDKDNKTLSRLRPSLIASGTIFGMALLSFVLIFLVLRIRQKQKKFTYGNTFPRTVFQVPVMNSRKLSNSSSNTIMIKVVATSTAKKSGVREMEETHSDIYDYKNDVENDSLDADDSWDTIPDFMK